MIMLFLFQLIMHFLFQLFVLSWCSLSVYRWFVVQVITSSRSSMTTPLLCLCCWLRFSKLLQFHGSTEMTSKPQIYLHLYKYSCLQVLTTLGALIIVSSRGMQLLHKKGAISTPDFIHFYICVYPWYWWFTLERYENRKICMFLLFGKSHIRTC